MPARLPPWIDVRLAKQRFAQIQRDIEALEGERATIELLLRGALAKPAVTKKPAIESSLVDLIVDALRLAPPEGRNSQQIMHHIAAGNPHRVSGPNASAAISSAIAQALRAKHQRIKVITRGGKGVSSTYAVA